MTAPSRAGAQPFLVSNVVTVEDAARWDGSSTAAIIAVAGNRAEFTSAGLCIRAANGTCHPVQPGNWVVRFGPGDMGVLSDGMHERWFGKGARKQLGAAGDV